MPTSLCRGGTPSWSAAHGVRQGMDIARPSSGRPLRHPGSMEAEVGSNILPRFRRSGSVTGWWQSSKSSWQPCICRLSQHAVVSNVGHRSVCGVTLLAVACANLCHWPVFGAGQLLPEQVIKAVIGLLERRVTHINKYELIPLDLTFFLLYSY